MDVYEALYTTRAMRRLKPDPIPADVQAKIVDAAIRAPSGGNTQNWRFMLVDDRDTIAAIAPIYHRCLTGLWTGLYKERIASAEAEPDLPESIAMMTMVRSAQHLADHFQDVPLLLFGFCQGDPSGGSIFPAIWSAQLAARAEGVGSTLTQALAFEPAPVHEILKVPDGQQWFMSCCVAFGYPTGNWGVAKRRPVHEVTYRNAWGEPLGQEIPQPLWPPS